MLKKSIIILVVITSAFNSSAQGTFVTNAKLLKSVTSNELNVVIPDNKYGEQLREVVKEYWTLTKYKFITEQELESIEDKKEINLLGSFKGTFMAHSYELSNIPFLGVVNKYSSRGKYSYQKKNIAAHVLLPLETIADEDLKTVLIMHVKSIQLLIKTGGMKQWYGPMLKSRKEVKNKTVIICKDDLDGALTNLKEKYSGKIKVVEKSEYNKLILNDKKSLFLMSLKDDSMYNFLSIISSEGVVFWTDLNHSAAKKGWDKEFLIRFFKTLK